MTGTMLNRLREWAKNNPLPRPPVEALDAIDTIVRDIREAEESIKFLHKRLEDEARVFCKGMINRQDLSKAATYVYWMLPEVSSRWLAYALEQREGANPKTLHNWVEPIPTLCEHCGADGKLECRTREELHKTLSQAGKGSFVCAECLAKPAVEWRAQHEAVIRQFRAGKHAKRDEQITAEQAKREAQEKRLWELRRMPYAEYLQTPEWKDRRKRHLESVGYRCQLCNGQGGGLRIHHRNYEQRGQERFQDLIVLCQHCHNHYHKGIE